MYNNTNSNIPVNHVSNVELVNDTSRWVGTINGGLLWMVNDSFTVYNVYTNTFPDNSMFDLKLDTNGFLWAACPSGGLVRGLGSTFYSFNTATSGIPSNSFNALLIDSIQNIYLGSFDRGLIKKTGNFFTWWDTQNSPMPDDLVYCVAQEKSGIIWMGTNAHGVVRFDENSWTNVAASNEQTAINVFPNPCLNNLQINSKTAIKKITIVDLMGKKQIEQEMNSVLNPLVDVSMLKTGTYFISIETNNRPPTITGSICSI